MRISWMLDDLDLSTIVDEHARHAIRLLLNLVETLSAENRALREEVQRLRDENNRLKGEQGKPDIKSNKRPPPTNHSSEAERHKERPHQKGRKLDQITIDRTEDCRVDPAVLPADAEFKDYVPVVVQDLVLRTDNVLFRKEKWYAASTGQTYLADLPAGYDGEYGPNIKALAIVLAYGTKVSQPQILDLFRSAGSQLSAGTLSNWLIHDQEAFHAEKAAIVEAGLRSSPWQQADDTATRVNGQNQYCQILCNPLYTAYRTSAAKDRLSVLDVLRNGRPRTFRLNADALAQLEAVGIAQITRQRLLLAMPWEQDLDEGTIHALLATELPQLGVQARKWIVDATAVAAYHAQLEFPIVRLLVCDDAPQFQCLTDDLALCWVHDGRHYKKLEPCIALHRRELTRFLKRYWAFYDKLLAYRARPSPAGRRRLSAAFDRLFATVTGYQALDERIAKTRSKKAALLLVLEHPEIPLHNNASELAARRRVRKRDVSFGPRTVAGTRAWDTFMTIAATAQKLGVSFYHYILDRVSEARQMPNLADLIDQRAKDLNLGASWGAV
jgi:hypothetical protein